MNDFPQDDSPDFDETEASAAEVTSNVADLTQRLSHLSCGVCGGRMALVQHQRRFRKPHHYTRMSLSCGEGHTETRTYRMDWIAP